MSFPGDWINSAFRLWLFKGVLFTSFFHRLRAEWDARSLIFWVWLSGGANLFSEEKRVKFIFNGFTFL